MLTDKFMHIHIPHTAGGTFRVLIHKLIGDDGLPGCRVIDWTPHKSWCWYEREARKAQIPIPPAFAFIRNPYEWYVSTHLYQVQKEGEGGIDPNLGFEEWMRGLYQGKFDYRFYKTLTYLWTQSGADRATYVGRFEHLEKSVIDLTEVFLWGIVSRQTIGEVFRSLPRLHHSQYPLWDPPYPYREFYTDQTRRWVEEWDAELLERFEYQW